MAAARRAAQPPYLAPTPEGGRSPARHTSPPPTPREPNADLSLPDLSLPLPRAKPNTEGLTLLSAGGWRPLFAGAAAGAATGTAVATTALATATAAAPATAAPAAAAAGDADADAARRAPPPVLTARELALQHADAMLPTAEEQAFL